MTLADRLRSLRIESGKTLRDVQAISGISISHLSGIERGTYPSVDVLERIADVYGMELSELLRGVRINGSFVLDYCI
jgi:transcriptional regulator with XRE-family HTH domain